MSRWPDQDADQLEVLRFAALRAVREIDAADERATRALTEALMCAAWPTRRAQRQ